MNYIYYIYYGLVNQRQALDTAKAVCAAVNDLPGHYSLELLLETAAQETRLGTVKDPSPYRAGTGLCQIDPIGFKDAVERCPPAWKAMFKLAFDVDISKVQYVELEHSPLLSFIFCRIHYRLAPGAIPATVPERAAYWKTFYNSVLGAGTPLEYIGNATLATALLGSV